MVELFLFSSLITTIIGMVTVRASMQQWSKISNAVFIALAAVVVAVAWVIKLSKSRTRTVPPGRMGWPLLGETLELIAAYRTSNPEPFAQSRRARYGPVFKTHILGKPTVFSTDPEMNRFVLQNEGKVFASSYPQTLAKLLGRNSLLLTQGHLHKELYALTWSFTNSSVLKQHLMADIEGHVCTALDGWLQYCNDHHFLLLHMQDEAKKITFNVTVSQLLSASPGPWTESLCREYLQLVEGFFSLPINLPGTNYRKALQARSEIAKRIKEIVSQRRSSMQCGGHAGDLSGACKRTLDQHHDLLGALLRQNMTDQQIVDMVISLLVAGYETTSMIMTLAVKFLIDHPTALKRLRAEHRSIKRGKKCGDKLCWNDYKSMRFTQCVINETLRMGNMVGGVFRKALKDVDMQGYYIPKGWVVFTSFRAVHFDEANYADAQTFNPWRWEGGNMSAKCSLNFTPFGGGPRFCPGYELARVQLSVFLYYLATQFSWEAAEDDKLIFFPTTRMVKRLPVKLRQLQASDEDGPH